MTDTDFPEIIELSDQESDWVFWPAPSQFLPEEIGNQICVCGHGNLGPDWHSHDCRVVVAAWKWRAKQLHDEVWRLRRKLAGEPEPDEEPSISIQDRCCCGPQPDDKVRFHRRGADACKAGERS
jgi:hypothetical protein